MTANKKQPEVADIFRRYGKDYRQNSFLSNEQSRAMRHVEMCRTAELGGHTEVCNNCGFEQNAYNSCRDRHCPKCQTLVKEKWLNDRKAELLPCPYFHNVFTLPHELNPLILINMRVMLAILFAAANETLQGFSRDPQWRLVGQLGFISVLHTWNQKLMDHFHLHCIIPAGAFSFDRKRWIAARENYLFKIESLAKEFQKRYLQKLEKLYDQEKLSFCGDAAPFADRQNFIRLINTLWDKQWITYSKQPFGGPEQVLEYLGRYTHRVAITNNRILSVEGECVTFSYRDRSDENKVKELPIKAAEFMRRFLLHILPGGFMKIRYFGFLAHTNKKASIPLLRQLIGQDVEIIEKIKETVQEMMLRLTGIDISNCPECGKGKMVKTIELPKLLLNTS
jgi:predicted Zn-ribbon and HTH transcriptional regulator